MAWLPSCGAWEADQGRGFRGWGPANGLPGRGAACTISLWELVTDPPAAPNHVDRRRAFIWPDWGNCAHPSPLVKRRNGDFSYDGAPSPAPMFQAPRGTPTSRASKMAVSPRAPKAGGALRVTVTASNTGSAPGTPGVVGVWVVKMKAAFSPWSDPVHGDRCEWSSPAASADFSSTTVAAGKSRSLVIRNVPVPSAPGEYLVAVVVRVRQLTTNSPRKGASGAATV